MADGLVRHAREQHRRSILGRLVPDAALAAAQQARSLGCEVVGLTGRDGGALKGSCDTAVVAPSDDTAHIQECHIVVVHLLCALIEQGLDLA